MSEGNGRAVTVRELNDKLNGIRWELRCYALLLIIGVLLRFNVPHTAAAVVLHLI